jgi:chromatin structure-remodeling complex subunit RSC1/2
VHANAYNPPRSVEVYHLSDIANASIPQDIREQFHRDEHDRILFFTAPPLDVPRPVLGGRLGGHSLKYLAKKARDEEALAQKQRERDERLESEMREKRKREAEDEERRREEVKRLKSRAIEVLIGKVERGTEEIYEELYNGDAKMVMEEGRMELEKMQREEERKRTVLARHEMERKDAKFIQLARVTL